MYDYAYVFVRQYRSVLEPDDIVSIVLLAIEKCKQHWDGQYSSFSTYAFSAIQHDIIDAIRSNTAYLRVKGSVKPTYSSSPTFPYCDVEDMISKSELTSMQEYVVRSFYLKEKTINELARELKLSSKCISRIKDLGLRKIKRRYVNTTNS